MGAGAVGCYYGAMLARAGHDVVLVGRRRHVDAIRRDGLRFETAQGTETIGVDAQASAQAVAGAQIVLFCVKSTDTDVAAVEMAPYLADDAMVLSLQNGVDNAERIRAHVRQRVESAIVYVAAAMAGDGHVRHYGRGELLLARGVLMPSVLDDFASAGVAVLETDNLVGALWGKLIVNCACNALSAITQQPYGELWRDERISALMREIVRECAAIARADGVTLPDDGWPAVERIMLTMPAQRSSTAQDLALGRRTEIDHLNGFVWQRAQALGLAAPINQTLHALVRQLELAGLGAIPEQSPKAAC